MIYRITTAIAAMSLAGWLGLVVGDRSSPTTVESARLLTPVVKPGGELLTERTIYRHKLCFTRITRFMFDSRGVRFDLSEQTYSNGTGTLGRETFIGRQPVHKDMAPGPARYVALPCYRCSWAQWLWPLCEAPREQRFTVE